MIPAVADSCSVRLDKVNRKVYKFRALVFRQGKLSEVSISILEDLKFPVCEKECREDFAGDF